MGEGLLVLIFGCIAAVVGVALPGLLNMTAVKIFKEEGRKNVSAYLSGASMIIFIQTFIAVFAAKIIDSSPLITNALHEIGLGVFTILTLYFLVFAKKTPSDNSLKTTVTKRKQHRFLYGCVLAVLNVFPIPYYVFISVTLASYQFPIFEQSYNFLFSLGVVLGSVLMFSLYIAFFNKESRQNSFVLRNMNYCIGSVTALVALIALCKILFQ